MPRNGAVLAQNSIPCPNVAIDKVVEVEEKGVPQQRPTHCFVMVDSSRSIQSRSAERHELITREIP